jgi:hypothetical protein
MIQRQKQARLNANFTDTGASFSRIDVPVRTSLPLETAALASTRQTAFRFVTLTSPAAAWKTANR